MIKITLTGDRECLRPSGPGLHISRGGDHPPGVRGHQHPGVCRGEVHHLMDVTSPALQVSSVLSFSLAQGGNNTVMDQVQTVYQCCGVRGAQGYDQWRDYLEVSLYNVDVMTSSGDQDLYPDSCCTLKYPGCGQQAMATLSSDFANTFSDMLFTEGCLTVLRW